MRKTKAKANSPIQELSSMQNDYYTRVMIIITVKGLLYL